MTFNPRDWPSASSAEANVACPGKFQAERNLPELPHDKDDLAEIGTIIHALWTGSYDPDKHRPATHEEADKAQALREAEEQACRHYFGEGVETLRFVEQRLTLSFGPYPNDPDARILRCSGQFDVARVHTASQRVLLCDGKSGWLTVTPNPRNLQLRWQAGLYYENIGAEEIAVGILKPHGKPSPLCVYSKDDLAQAVLEMEAQVRAMFSPDAKRVPGEMQCRYCRSRNVCKERAEWLAAAIPAFGPPACLPMAVPPSQWTPEQRVRFLDVEKSCREWIDSTKDEIKALLAKDPEAAPGYGLRDGKTLETIVDPAEVHRRFVGDMGGSRESFMKTVRIQKADLKSEVRSLTGDKGKSLEKVMETLLQGCVEEKKCEPTIVRVKE